MRYVAPGPEVKTPPSDIHADQPVDGEKERWHIPLSGPRTKTS